MNNAGSVSPCAVRVEATSRRGLHGPPRRCCPPACSWLIVCLIASCWPLAVQAQTIAPHGLTAVAGDRSAVLQWTQSGNPGIVRWEYRFRRAPNGVWVGWIAIPGDYTTYTHTVTGLVNGNTYAIDLRSVDGGGPGRIATVTVALPATPNRATTVPDARLRAALAARVGKGPNDEITSVDLARIRTLDAAYMSISDLTGLRHAINLATLNLGNNRISDLEPLAGLMQLEVLTLATNNISDVAPLANLMRLRELDLAYNRVTTLGALASLGNLETLVLAGNGLIDISPLAQLSGLRKLNLARNGIFDLRPLTSLTRLRDLNLTQNDVRNIAALVDNGGLGVNDAVDLRANPLNEDAVTVHVPALRRRGVNVVYLPAAPERLQVVAGRGEATISWALGAATVSGYEVRHGPGNPPRLGAWMPIEGSSSRTVQHTVRGLPAGGAYTFELRAVGLAGAGPPARVATTRIEAPNQAPQVILDIPDQQLEPGERFDTDLKRHFADADDETLTYQAYSSTRAAPASILGNSILRVAGAQAGASMVRVTARDGSGASATIRFVVSVGIAVTVADVVATEGETAELLLQLTRPRTLPTVIPYAIAADADPATADADARDHRGVAGTVTIAAGETSAQLSIRIVDDDDAEPAREVFLVTFQQTSSGAGYTLARRSATVTIAEGVCDRTPAIRDALRGPSLCSAPTPATLAEHRFLALRGRGIATLRTGDLQGLRGLETLELSNNDLATLPPGSLADLAALTTLTLTNNRLSTLTADALAGANALDWLGLGRNRLASLPTGVFAAQPALRVLRLEDNQLAGLPDGLFSGLGSLEEVDLSGNPGAPFPLTVSLARTDAAAVAAGPATVLATIDTGMPFASRAEVSWEGGGPALLAFAAGDVESSSFSVPAADGAVRLSLAPPALPDTLCGDLLAPCFRGLAMAGSTLALYQPPPRVVRAAPQLELLGADSARFDLSTFFEPTDGGSLSYSATSSNSAVATASVVGGHLVVDTAEASDEASVEVLVTASDTGGQTVSLTFAITVQPALGSFMRGWRQGLPTVVPTTGAPEAVP